MKSILALSSFIIGIVSFNCAAALNTSNGFNFKNTASDYSSKNVMKLVFNSCPDGNFQNAKSATTPLPATFPNQSQKISLTIKPSYIGSCKVVYSNGQTACVITVSQDKNKGNLIEVRAQQRTDSPKKAATYFCSINSDLTGYDINTIVLTNPN
ncbi:MAG: hypothetical protein P1U34_07475 [Coxiellaceae bacterium]|nr:hypothetical protein [Coxiellaceae bacterium]